MCIGALNALELDKVCKYLHARLVVYTGAIKKELHTVQVQKTKYSNPYIHMYKLMLNIRINKVCLSL